MFGVSTNGLKTKKKVCFIVWKTYKIQHVGCEKKTNEIPRSCQSHLSHLLYNSCGLIKCSRLQKITKKNICGGL